MGFLFKGAFSPKFGNQNNAKWRTAIVFGAAHELAKAAEEAAKFTAELYEREQAANLRNESVQAAAQYWLIGIHPGDDDNAVHSKQYRECLRDCAEVICRIFGVNILEVDIDLLRSKIITAKALQEYEREQAGRKALESNDNASE